MNRGAAQQEIVRERPQSRDEYLESFEKQWEEIHEGIPPELGIRIKGNPERKDVCEDVKLKNAEKGLFLVADGVSSAQGWLAARETARVAYEILGEELDRGVENNIRKAFIQGENPLDRVTQYVASQMRAAVALADKRVQTLVAADRKLGRSSTTLSLSKLIELPDEKGGTMRRLFFTNVGDSRVYIMRGGKIKRLTRDDSLLQLWVERGGITQEQADEIDQAEDPMYLHPRLQRYARGRAMITKAVGSLKAEDVLNVFFYDVKKGDRLVIVSDGVSDQMLESEIAARINTKKDDNQAEKALQQSAMERAIEGTHARAKGDDISALVYTVEERGPSRDYLKPEVQKVHNAEALRNDVKRYKNALDKIRARVLAVEREIEALDNLTPMRKRLKLMIELERARKTKSAMEYNFEKCRLGILDKDLPPRFGSGDKVEVWRDDFDPPGFDRKLWTVAEYDGQAHIYTVIADGEQPLQISRYELESARRGLLARVGDVLPAQNEDGTPEKGFKIIAFDKDGTVVLEKKKDGVLKHTRVPIADVNNQYLRMIYSAENARQRMEQAGNAYFVSKKNLKSLSAEKIRIERLESRQRARDAAKSLT